MLEITCISCMPTDVETMTFYLGFAVNFTFSKKRIYYRGNKSDKKFSNMSDRYVQVYYPLLFIYMFENIHN